MTAKEFNRDYKAFMNVDVYDAKSNTHSYSNTPLTGAQFLAIDDRFSKIMDAYHTNTIHNLGLSYLCLIHTRGCRPSYDVLCLRKKCMNGNLSYNKIDIIVYSK